MSLEKPFSTIRKAIQGSAENRASKELLDKPEERHYKDAFHFFKSLRAFSPEKVELFITLTAKNKELRNAMGAELYKIFSRVMEDLSNRNEKQFNEAVEQIKTTKKLSHQEMSEDVKKLKERFIKEIVNEFKNDSRIVSAFAGKEKLLNKGIEFAKFSSMSILDAYQKSPARPQLEEITWKEAMETIARYRRGKKTSAELREEMLQRDKLPEGLFAKIIKFFRSIN